MDYYCDVCPKYIKLNSNYSRFKSKSYEEFHKCKHTILPHKDIDKNDVDEAFYLYIIEHNKTFDYYLLKCEFKLVFDDYQYHPHVTFNYLIIKQRFLGRIFR